MLLKHFPKLKVILYVIITMMMITCKTKSNVSDRKCPSYVSKSIKNIAIDKFKYITNTDTLSFNEVKFYCVNNTALYTKKVMFDKFGKWSKEIYPNNEMHPILLWENLKLFEKDSTTFTIATLGDESFKTIYASFMVFDSIGNDFLSDINYKEKLIPYFEDLIKKSNPKRPDFYDIYWKAVELENRK
ncbi:hypothetical protein GQ41_1677 [Arenibacter algicola]|uniref:Lipoprotein n=2 Tax=Arenibacter algicola TaxID=616991 RepID=A0ABY3A936_9FLAO